jgi:hypothetical protein
MPRGRTILRAPFVAFVALALFAVALMPGAAIAGPFEVKDTTWEGGSELYEIAKTELGPERVKPVATLDWSALKPEDGVLVLHPTQPVDAGEASDFMKAGGRLAIVDDYGRGDDLLHRFKIEREPMPSKPVAELRNNPSLPIAEPWIDPKRPSSAPHPIVANVKRLVLNHPVALIHPDLSSVLMVRAVGEDPAIVAVAGQVGKGRLFAMGDPSALINEMLRYPGNRAFAAGLVRYLAGGDDHAQARLYILTNKFAEEGSVGGDKTVAKEIEQFLHQLAESLGDAQKNGLPKWVFIVLAIVLVGALAIWVARASGKPYRNPTPRYARPTPLVARGGVAGRFALLAAPTSAKGLVLLELKTALGEALAQRFNLEPNPSGSAMLRTVRDSRRVPDDTLRALEDVLRQMQRAEAVALAGGQIRVNRDAVAHAARVVEQVLAATSPDDAPLEARGRPPEGSGGGEPEMPVVALGNGPASP